MLEETATSWYARMQEAIEAMYVAHNRFVPFVNEVETRFFQRPPSSKKKNLILSGATGAGKSTIIEKVLSMHPREPNAREVLKPSGLLTVADYVPVLVVEMPSKPSYVTFTSEILRVYRQDMNYEPRGNYLSLGRQVDAAVKACGTKVIIVDDAQRFADSTRIGAAWEVAECIKDRLTATGVGFALFGLGRVKRLLDEDEQFERRFDSVLRMQPYEWNTLEALDRWDENNEWPGVLAAFQRVCPLEFDDELRLPTEEDGDAELTDTHIMTMGRFHYATRGWPGYVKDLLQNVLEVMVRTDQRNAKVSRVMLATAYTNAFAAKPMFVNPFTDAWKGEVPPPLDQDDESLTTHATRARQARTKRQRRAEVVSRLSKR